VSTKAGELHAALAAFLTRYNTQRPHRSLNGHTPIQRLAERNKTAATYS
jgi:transposase InsO family protein